MSLAATRRRRAGGQGCAGSRWVAFDKGREHLFYFPRASLQRTLERAGFEPMRGRPHSRVCSAVFAARRGTKIAGTLARARKNGA